MRPRWMMVVAGAIEGSDGRWLMHQRPLEKHHGGLWEFPGGKVEPTEMPVESLVRELREELGIEIFQEDCRPAGFAQGTAQDGKTGIVILLYTVGGFTGTPQALEGEAIGWFAPPEIEALDKPPLDIELARQLFAGVRQIG